MDYQIGILERVDEQNVLLGIMKTAIALARSAAMTVGYVRVGLSDDERSAVPDRNKAFSALPTLASPVHADAPETAIHPDIAPMRSDIIVCKQRVGPFSTTDLGEQLDALGIDTLILAGISTSGVVLSSVRHAADADYRIYVLADATFDPDPEVHEILMTKIFPRQAWVITVDELDGLIDKSA